MIANQTQMRHVRWLDDPNQSTPDGSDIGTPDGHGLVWRPTLACLIDGEAEGFDADAEVADHDDLIAREVARLARRVRASGARTVAEFLAIEP